MYGTVQVALFNNQQQEVTQYDAYLSQYQAAMVNIEKLAATLNAGQAAILNVGIAAALVSAVWVTPGGISPGDLILIQGMLLQLWAPLQFLGWFFRCVHAPSPGCSNSFIIACSVVLCLLAVCSLLCILASSMAVQCCQASFEP